MTKRVISKAIAIMLVASMCLVAVFTGAVSAETRSATCTVTGKGYDVGARDSLVYANVTFQSSTAFTAGTFEVAAEGLTLVDCSPAVENDGNQPNVKLNVSNKRVLFYGFSESADNDIKSYTDLTLVLKFTINNGSLYNSAAGTQWNVTVSNINITNVAEETYTTPNATNTDKAPIHVHNYTGASENGSFTTKTCSICGAKHAEVTNTTGLGSNNLKDSAAANVTFDETGYTVLNALLPDSVAVDNVYFIYHYTVDENGVNTEKTGTAVSAGTVTYNGTTYHVFPCGRNGGIGRISRDVTGNFVVVNGSTVTISKPWTYSIQEYCKALSGGSYGEKHQNYAKALLNYGYWTTDALVKKGQTSYNTDKATYGDNMPISLTHFELPASKAAVVDGTDDNWNLDRGLSVTTGFKPKMNIKFTAATAENMDTITVQVKDGTEVVYYKEIATSIIKSNSNTYVLSDVPTKYLVGDIVIGAKKNGADSNKTITYSYAKYARARQGQGDANVFQSLMDYASYLKAAF